MTDDEKYQLEKLKDYARRKITLVTAAKLIGITHSRAKHLASKYNVSFKPISHKLSQKSQFSAPVPIKPDAVIPEDAIPFADTKYGQCVWLFGGKSNWFACGKQTQEGSSYCLEHRRKGTSKSYKDT